MTAGQREVDIVLYGATGFVGKLTAEYLAARAGTGGADVGIALAGRSADKLRALRDSLGESAASWPIIVAESDSPSALNAMAARTSVVLTTVGPYLKSGLPLVAACAAAGTDYADLSGEAIFVREAIDLYHKQAIDNGVRIVPGCGFDSIPSDLTVYMLYKRAKDDGAGHLQDTNFVLRGFPAGFSGGTYATAVELMTATSADPEARRATNDPYTLTVDRAAEPELGPQPDLLWRRGGEIAPELEGIWTGAFIMAPGNTRIVRRSNALQGWAYGPRFRYAETMSVGSSLVAPVAAAVGTAVNVAVVGLGSRYLRHVPRRLIDRILPKPGTGPSERAREQGHYTVETYTTTSSGARYRATMSQRGDPGYKATSVLLGECGLALATDRDTLSDLRGVLTPASAMGDALLARLPAAGVTLETVRLD